MSSVSKVDLGDWALSLVVWLRRRLWLKEISSYKLFSRTVDNNNKQAFTTLFLASSKGQGRLHIFFIRDNTQGGTNAV